MKIKVEVSSYSLDSPSLPCSVTTQESHKTRLSIFTELSLLSSPYWPLANRVHNVRADKETAVSVNWVNTYTGEIPRTRDDHEHCTSSPIQGQLAAFSLDAMSKVAPDSRAWKWKAKAILEGYTWMAWEKNQILTSPD